MMSVLKQQLSNGNLTAFPSGLLWVSQAGEKGAKALLPPARVEPVSHSVSVGLDILRVIPQ